MEGRRLSRLLIMYGSHTGQAESISKQLAERAEAVGIKADVHTLNEKEPDLTKESFVVIIVSSTGDGDAPENCARFVRKINRRGLSENFLRGLEYCLLGLGDSNYSTFQGVPIKVDHALSSLGAKRLLERGEADDQVGLELVVEPWIEKLFNEVLAEKFLISSEKLASSFSSKLSLAAAKDQEEKDRIMEEWKKKSAVIGSEGFDDAIPSLPSLPLVACEYKSGASIRSGAAKLAGDPNLRVPLAPQPFLKGELSQGTFKPENTFPWQNNAAMPGVISTVPVEAVVVSHSIITSLNAQKPKREMILEVTDEEMIDYEPGDAFYFVTENMDEEVTFILQRMGVLHLADCPYALTVDPDTPKQGASLPLFIPPNSSLRHLFTKCLDIRRAPGRPLLRVLADTASDGAERRRLLELCSAQGVSEFTTFVRQASLSVVDVLLAFPSAKPEPERLIENLPRLMPRPYSVSSCQSTFGRRIRFAYSIMEDEAEEGRRYKRVGVQTHALCNLRIGETVQLLRKDPARFRLPPLGCLPEVGLYSPLVLIGPGTGVSTFLSFLHHLRKYKRDHPSDEKFISTKRVVYFGCRDTTKDYIYREELEAFLSEGIISGLYVAESSIEGRPKYVQDCIRAKAQDVAELIRATSESEYPARIFVCGDAKGMSKGLWECFAEIMHLTGAATLDDARKYMIELKKTDRYVEDVWS